MAQSILNLARQRYAAGALTEVLALLEGLATADSEALLLRGVCLARLRRAGEARLVFSELLATEPDSYEALTWVAILCKNREQISEALGHANRAIQVRPSDAAGYGVLGGCYLYLRQAPQAIESLEKAVSLAPEVAEHRHNLGLAYQLAQRRSEAAQSFREAMRLAPNNLQSYLALGSQFSLFGIPGQAIEVFNEGLSRSPNSAALHSAVAGAFAAIKNDQAAAFHYQRAMELSPDANGDYAFWLLNQGRFQESEDMFHQMLDEKPNRCRAYYGLMQTRKLTPEDSPLVASMEAARDDRSLPMSSKLFVYYALGKAYEHLKRFEESMGSYDMANRLAFEVHNAGFPYEPDSLIREHEKIKACYEKLPQLHAGRTHSSPVFIVGMIRSGTTLMEQIVSSHPQVSAAGELRYWIEEGARLSVAGGDRSLGDLTALSEEYTSYTELIAGKADRITDKMPLNFTYIGLIARAMPHARFIHIRRNPVDTCLSIYTTYFGKGPQFAYDKSNIARYYLQYLEVMQFWRGVIGKDQLLEVDYESLTSDPETVIRQVIAFCALPWDEACLRHERNESPINTPSRWQARQPIYRSSTERWRKFEPWLGAFEVLKQAASA